MLPGRGRSAASSAASAPHLSEPHRRTGSAWCCWGPGRKAGVPAGEFTEARPATAG